MNENFKEDENDYECNGIPKHFLKLGGNIEECPDCEHWNAIAIVNKFVDDLEIDNEENWDLCCQCCGSRNNALYH